MHLNIHFHYFSTEITSSIQPVGRFIYHAKNLTVSTLITWAMHAEILKKLLVFLFQRKGIEIREESYFKVLYGRVDRSVSNQHSLPSLLPTITLSPTHKKCDHNRCTANIDTNLPTGTISSERLLRRLQNS